jgi:undecaprenyl-diphosphatase
MTMFDAMVQCDLRLLKWCVKSREHEKFIALTRAISRSGDGFIQALVPLLIAWQTKSMSFVYLTLLAFTIERILYWALKNSLKRKRPPDIVPDFSCVVMPSDKFSFPSGHTMAAFLLSGLCALELGSVATPIYLWAIAVGCSRVILGVHFPSDILAGAVIGTLLTFAISP